MREIEWGDALRIVAAIDTSQALSLQQRSFAKASVKVNSVAHWALRDIGVHAVPQIALIDSTGIVNALWVGLLDEEEESEVFEAAGLARE